MADYSHALWTSEGHKCHTSDDDRNQNFQTQFKKGCIAQNPHSRLSIKGNAVLEKFLWRSVQNGLEIDTARTKAIAFRPVNKHIDTQYAYKIGTSRTEIVNLHKTLGLISSEYMQWDHHIKSLTHKLSKAAGISGHHRSLLPKKVKIKIYHALFGSQIKYSPLVWRTTTKAKINKPMMLQKKRSSFQCKGSMGNTCLITIFKLQCHYSFQCLWISCVICLCFFNFRINCFLSDPANLTKRESAINVRHR